MTRFSYAVQNRVLAADCALPFLTPPAGDANGDTETDLTLTLTVQALRPPDATLWYRSEAAGDATLIHESRDAFVIDFSDGTSFVIEKSGRAISIVAAPARYDTADLASYALGPVLAFALHLQGSILLHASCVALRGRGVLFCGASGSGKSTTAAILAQQDYEVLSDDLAEISSSRPHRVLPSGGVLRLWSDSVERLYGDASALPELAPSWAKRFQRLADGTALPLGAILVLESVKRSEHPLLEPLPSKSAWGALMANAFTARLPDQQMSKRIFSVMASVADSVPAFAFVPPRIEQSADLGAWLESALEAVL